MTLFEIIQNPQIVTIYGFLFLLVVSFFSLVVSAITRFFRKKDKNTTENSKVGIGFIEITTVFLINIIALIANDIFVYIADLFITATLFTQGEYLLTLIAIMRGDKNWFNFQQLIRGTKPTPPSDPETQKTSMEYKILNTLWTKQVNYFPDHTKLWGFTVNKNAINYAQFHDAANKLIGAELVVMGEQEMYFLTKKGIQFCAKNYASFPEKEDQYWPEEKIKSENLKIATDNANNL